MMMQDEPQEKMEPYPEDHLEKPPFFKHWSGMYWLVIGNLVFLIMLFYLLTAYYE